MNMMRRAQWMGWMMLAVLAAGCGRKEAQVVEPRKAEATEVSVWVDQAGITQGEIQREASRLFGSVAQNVPPEQIPEVQVRLLSQAVDNLVVRQLVKAEMERSGVLISREEIEKGKRDLEQGLGPDHSLAMLLAAANLSVEELESNLVLDLFKNKVLKDQIDAATAAVTDEAVRKFYDEHPTDFTLPEGRIASHILIKVTPNSDEAMKADARARAEGIRKALLEGADFEALAREVSHCASRTRGGRLGVIPRNREAPAFEEAVYSQEIGEIGEVVETPVGFHVIQVTGEQDERLMAFDEVSERLKGMLLRRAQQQITKDYIEELKSKATIKLDGALAEAVAQAEAAKAEASAEPQVSGESAP
jgi:peptidyl-prolyl cis-trans isomerase C